MTVFLPGSTRPRPGHGRAALSLSGDGGERNPDAFHCLQRHPLVDGGGGYRGGADAVQAELQGQRSSLAPLGAPVQQNERSEGATAIAGVTSIFNRRTSRALSPRTKAATMRETTTQAFRASHRPATPDGRNPTSGSVPCKSRLTQRHSGLIPICYNYPSTGCGVGKFHTYIFVVAGNYLIICF